MATKDPEKIRQQQQRWYKKHKATHLANVRRAKRELAVWFADLKSSFKCVSCPENHQSCLDFHHRDPSRKVDEVSKMVARGYSKESILAEIAKCDPMCANCHRKFHWNERFPAMSASCSSSPDSSLSECESERKMPPNGR